MPQSLSAVYVHIVFSVKRREPLILPTVESDLHAYLGAIFRECDSPALRIGGTSDHVHVLCSLSRTRTVADVIEEAKKRSSKWLKLKDDALQSFQWQAGYGAFSVGGSGVAAVCEYIRNQRDHHEKRSFEDEYRTLLRKYGVAYDERYVWD
jgi:REP element-mobilizing transposase RayT